MGTTVQARLDEETKAALDDLARRKGWSASRIIREGIRLLERDESTPRPKMIGIGMFASGIPDGGSNKKYLEGLGSDSGIGRKRATQPKQKAG